ncbi:MAG: amino acid adenylation domain-containing protein [Deltaproteobacteria bacterium]|nr:amino acid adenylation domain-containing protein [Deltaproteobacteria bacterium]
MTELLQDWVTARAQKDPEAVAVVLNQKKMTYGQLDRLSNQLARILKAGGCRRGDRVGLLMPNCPAAVVGLLGIYKADAIYVPLDPLSPAARLKKMMASIESPWILAAGPVGPVLDDLLSDERFRFSVSVGWLEPEGIEGENFKTKFSLADFDAYSSGRLDYRNRRQDPAHMFFTSGSTGTPKGVVVAHSSAIEFTEWAVDYFGMNASDRNSGHMGLHFDVSIYDMFGTFATGAELHIVPPELNLLPNKLADFIRRSELTQWFSVPSILNYTAKFDVVRPGDFPSLKRLLWCGEVLPTPALIYWMKRLPHVRFTNLYGPTETTILSTYYTVPACPEDERAPIPIGTPCPGEELLVLDEKLQPVPPGQVGDIYIRGVGLSLGYWRDPEKTRAAFLPNPQSSDPADRIYKTGDLGKVGEDGLFYFLGRKDYQIKCRGYRVELGEVEAALNALNLLQECAVVAIAADGFEGTKICCGYVAQPGNGVSPPALRTQLAKALPFYMVPSRWMALEQLPRNPNGKIDRPRLAGEFGRKEAPALSSCDVQIG